MRKFITILILLLAFPGTIYASDLYQEKLDYENRLNNVIEAKEQTEDKSEIISLSREEMKLKNKIRAYNKALEQTKAKFVMNSKTSFILNNHHAPPLEYIDIYKAAAQAYNMDWTLLAAVHKVETNFSTHPTMISSAGAIGHMQFMPGTWDYYGVDGDGDGVADPWNIYDAIYSAAHYLSKSGASDGDIKGALFAYNRSTPYGEKVMAIAQSYQEGHSDINLSLVEVGKQYISNSTYVFGGGRNEKDIQLGIFDCSSFVHWALDQVGINAGNLSSVTTDTLKHLGENVSVVSMQPGDLVFFDTYKIDGHVGIYVGDGKFIGAQESTGVAIADMSNGYWSDKFNGRVKRVH